MQTVYVPVKEIEEKPDDRTWAHVNYKTFKDVFAWDGYRWLDENNVAVHRTDFEWLKPTECVLLTKEDAEKIKSLIQKQINRCSHVDLMLTNTIAEDLDEALTILNKQV